RGTRGCRVLARCRSHLDHARHAGLLGRGIRVDPRRVGRWPGRTHHEAERVLRQTRGDTARLPQNLPSTLPGRDLNDTAHVSHTEPGLCLLVIPVLDGHDVVRRDVAQRGYVAHFRIVQVDVGRDVGRGRIAERGLTALPQEVGAQLLYRFI